MPLHKHSRLWHIPHRTISAASKVSPLPPAIELIGILAGIITTFGWVPQLIKIARERKAGDISLPTTASLAAGVSLWVVYGLFIGSWPVILANGVTFLFVASILGMKLRFG
jgi:MtN3 and saliva related transmembrane protein